jgi:hypothetical protein
MNHPFPLGAAKAMVERPDVAGIAEPAGRIDRLYRLAFGRAPTEEEAAPALSYVQDPEGGWPRFAQTLLLANEFAFVD